MSEPADPESDGAPVAARRGFLGEVRDAVSVRTFALVVGVLGLQLGFILSYVGAFHAPAPHRVPLVVAAPGPAAAQIAGRLNSITGGPLQASPAASPADARAAVTSGSSSAALIVNPSGRTDTLLVASGGGSSVVTAVQTVVTQALAAQGRSVSVRDVVPLQPGDARGLTGFYLVIGWIVGGYLVAALLGVSRGARPANTARATIRLLALVPYAVVSGLGGVIVVDQVLGALVGNFVALWWLGTLLVFTAGAVTMAFQTLFGVLGIGLTVLLFVILGNPSAGGAYQPSVLPPFWRAIAQATPNGAGTNAVRKIVYFGGHDIALDYAVITIYAAAGVLVTLTVVQLRGRLSRARP